MTTLSWEEKITKATETAKKKAEKEGLDEETTKVLVDEAVAKIKEAQVKAEKEAQVKEKVFVVSVKNNPSYCGIGAGGVQFANGKAEIKDDRMAEWFEEHDGYSVEVEER